MRQLSHWIVGLQYNWISHHIFLKNHLALLTKSTYFANEKQQRIILVTPATTTSFWFSRSTQSVQTTATKLSFITTKKSLGWHGVINVALAEIDQLNKWHINWEFIKKNNLMDHWQFWCIKHVSSCMQEMDRKALITSPKHDRFWWKLKET